MLHSGSLPVLTTRKPNQLLRAAREARGWSQEYVAEHVGVTARTVLRWENGATKPSPHYVFALRRLFGLGERELGLEFLCADNETSSRSAVLALAPACPIDIIGRESDLEAIVRRLLRGESLAITGIGGVGKTTLALLLAHHSALQAHYQDGILWGALGPEGNTQEIVSSWGRVLGFSAKQMASTSGEKSRSMLRAAIGNRAMLLILDDVWDEQIALTLREIAGPSCRWLYTSRLRKVAQDVAGGQHTYILSELTTERSVELVRRFAPAVVDLEPAVVQSLVCATGGVPLALRLIGRALARQTEHGPASLVQKRFEDFHEEREAIHSAIAVSEHALPEHARPALYALSVLPPKPAYFSPRAALAVTGENLYALYALRDFTLLEQEGTDDYQMHQVIADYCRQQLQCDPAAYQAAYDRLLQYAVEFVKAHENDYQALDGESQTIMAALEAAERLELHETLIQIMLGFAPYLAYKGWNQEAEHYLQWACQVARREQWLSQLPRLLFYFAECSYKTAAYEEAMKAQMEGLHLSRAQHNEEMTAAFVAQLAWQLYLYGKFDQAEAYIQEGLALFAATSHPNRAHLCTLLRAQGSLAWARGDYQASEQAYRQGLQVMQDMDEHNWDHLAIYYCFLAWIEGMQGHYEQAETLFQQSLAASDAYLPDFWPFIMGLRCQVILLHHPSRALREDLGQALTRALELTAIGYSIYVWKALALLEILLHNYDKAGKYVGYAIERAEQFRNGSRVGELLTIQAQIEIARGDMSKAVATVEHALPLIRETSPVEEVAGLLATKGEALLHLGRLDEAREAFAEARHFTPDEHCPLLAQIRYGQARLAAARGEKREARRMGEAALALFQQIRHYRVPEVETWLAAYHQPWLRLLNGTLSKWRPSRKPTAHTNRLVEASA